jgi:membrane protease YdiL (CAAX protease family)
LKNKIKALFAASPDYKQMVSSYTKKDTLIALGLYVFVIFAYLGLGIIAFENGKNFALGLILVIPVNIFLIMICIRLVKLRRQKPNSIGLTRKNLIKSLLLGLIAGGISFSFITIIPALRAGGKWQLEFGILLFLIFYQLVIVGFCEEIIFRGFIQTRLYGLIKSDNLAKILGGVLFATMHIPYNVFSMNGGNLTEFLANNSSMLVALFVWHFVFNFLYRKYNSLAAPVAFHCLMNISKEFFM